VNTTRFAPALTHRATPPFWLPLLAGLPITLCMLVMALPDLGYSHAVAFRTLYAIAFLLWSLPLTAIQRRLWRNQVRWWISAPVLLLITYAMSVANAAIALQMMLAWKLVPAFHWPMLFSSLDGCWLALIAFCAVHAVLSYYTALQAEQRRVADIAALARDAELRALRYQLHPHFLFNTLNAISTLVVEERTRDATRMIARLADFLRATLDSDGAAEHALADEIMLAEHYLGIEKARLGNRLQCVVSIDPDTRRATIPYLLLQPLIENAIRHGIAQRREGGSVSIHASRHANRLRLSLYNDGIPASSRPSPDTGTHVAVGLRNVRERLMHLYNEDHRFDLRIAANGSCTVLIELPFTPMPTHEPAPEEAFA
jgi:two-component system, LytTR family, sensor histidine kinase AlgZ